MGVEKHQIRFSWGTDELIPEEGQGYENFVKNKVVLVKTTTNMTNVCDIFQTNGQSKG